MTGSHASPPAEPTAHEAETADTPGVETERRSPQSVLFLPLTFPLTARAVTTVQRERLAARRTPAHKPGASERRAEQVK